MKTITGLFDTRTQAHTAVRDLEKAGVPSDRISILGRSEDEIEAGDGAATGAGIGVLAGGTGGLLAGLGLIAIPGIGPVVAAGWLASMAAGAATGGVAGSLVGALAGSGIQEDEATLYEEGVRRGGVLVAVQANEADEVDIRSSLVSNGAVDIHARRDAYLSIDPATDPEAPAEEFPEHRRSAPYR